MYASSQSVSRVWLFETQWTVACQAPLSMGILQERILEWVAFPFSRGSSQPRDRSHICCIDWRILYYWAPWEADASARPGFKHLLSTDQFFVHGQLHFDLFIRKKGMEILSISQDAGGDEKRGWERQSNVAEQCLAPSKCSMDVSHRYPRFLPSSTAVWRRKSRLPSESHFATSWLASNQGHRWEKLEGRGCSEPHPQDLLLL